MITLSLGNIGSGKTASVVRDMALNENNRKTYSNVKTSLNHQIDITPEMIIHQEIIGEKKKRDGTLEPVMKSSLNKDFWQHINEPINVVLDEAHTIFNSRRSMSKINIIMADWMAMLRRVLGNSESGYGELTMITQLPRRIDSITRDMATKIKYHVCHYQKTCKHCGATWQENSEMPEPLHRCPRCLNFTIKKHSHVIEVWHFANMNSFDAWKFWGQNSFHKHYFINDIEKYFGFYDTLQWEGLFDNIY